MSRTLIYFHVYIILDFPITYRNASVLCQSECACLHKTVIMVVFFVKSNENTFPKGRALMQMYRVVPQTKRGNYMYMTITKKNKKRKQSETRLSFFITFKATGSILQINYIITQHDKKVFSILGHT